MKIIGEIVSILDNNYVLAKTAESVKPGSKVAVYQIVKVKEPQLAADLKQIEIPKGKLTVVEKQSENIYLLKVSLKKEVKTIYNNDFALRISGLANILGTPERITEIVPEDETVVDQNKSLQLKINPKVTVGDLIKI